VRVRTPVVARSKQRIDDTRYRLLGARIRTTVTPSVATRAVVANALITTRRAAILQIPIAQRRY
jgi:hypothetical protein